MGAYTPDGVLLGRYTWGQPAMDTSTSMVRPGPEGPMAPPGLSLPVPARTEKSSDAKAIEAEIKRLQDQLAKLKSKPTQYSVMFSKEELPLEPTRLVEVLLDLAGKKFKNVHYTFTPSASGIALDGDKEVIEWAVVMIKKLADK
jgi:hypothetical protein